MRQANLIENGKVILQEAEKPTPSAGQVLIKVKYVGICGSDIHAYHGAHPYVSAPIVLGHEMSGEIVELGENVSSLAVGDRVTIMPQVFCGECEACVSGRYNICHTLEVIGCQTTGASSDYFAVDASLVKKMPPTMPYDVIATIEPAAVGVHAVRRTDIKGKNVVVLGAGTIGNLTAQAALAEGAKAVLISDLSDYRLNLAKECGIEHTVNTTKEDLVEAMKKAFDGNTGDVFFECVGIGATVEQAIQHSKKGHDIVIVGVFGKRAEVDFGLVQDRELRLIGTLMYLEEDYDSTLDYMVAGKIRTDKLISYTFPLESFDEAFHYIDENKETAMKVLIRIDESEA